MLIDTCELEHDPIQRFIRWSFTETIAECPETGARLKGSNGSRRAGAARRYYVTMPRSYLPAGLFDQEPVFGLTARTEQEAIEKANKRLARKAS